MYTESEYYDLWNEMDEFLVQYPELSELWLDRDKLATLRSRHTDKQELREYFRKRAFTALVMEKIFRIFEEAEEGQDTEDETITLDNEELQRIWEDDVKDEYEDYPEFIDYVKRNVFK